MSGLQYADTGLHVIVRKSPYLFGPKAGTKVTFKRGIRMEGLAEMGKAFKEGKSNRRVARELGIVNRTRIKRVRLALEAVAGKPFPREARKVPKFYSRNLEKIRELLTAGRSTRAIARATGSSEKRIRRLRRDMEEDNGGPFLCACGQPSGHKTYCPDMATRFKTPKYKLSPAIVMEARALHATGKWTYRALGRKYDTDESTVARAIKGQEWTHV